MTQQRPERSSSCPKTKIENRYHCVLARHEPLMSRAYTLMSQALITRTELSAVQTVVSHFQHRNDNASRTLVDQVSKKPQLGRLNIAILRKFSRVGQVSLRIGIYKKSEVMGGISNLPLISMIGIVLSKLNNHEKYVALNLVYFFTLYLKIDTDTIYSNVQRVVIPVNKKQQTKMRF